jgi:hypothetical protein
LPPPHPRGAPLGKEGALVADLLKLLLKIRSREIDVAARLLARSDELELLAAGVRKNLPMLKAGDLRCSAAMRSNWSKASWPSQWSTAIGSR